MTRREWKALKAMDAYNVVARERGLREVPQDEVAGIKTRAQLAAFITAHDPGPPMGKRIRRRGLIGRLLHL